MGLTKKSNKNTIKTKTVQLQAEMEKLVLTTLQEREIGGDEIEYLKIINRISNCGRLFFLSIFLLELEIFCQDRFQNPS